MAKQLEITVFEIVSRIIYRETPEEQEEREVCNFCANQNYKNDFLIIFTPLMFHCLDKLSMLLCRSGRDVQTNRSVLKVPHRRSVILFKEINLKMASLQLYLHIKFGYKDVFEQI